MRISYGNAKQMSIGGEFSPSHLLTELTNPKYMYTKIVMNENTVITHVRLAWEVTVPPSLEGFGPQMGRKVNHSMDMRFTGAKIEE